MSSLLRIPALIVALGLLVSGGQAKVCEVVAIVGIDLHAPAEDCPHGHEGHSHSGEHSESEPCSEDCIVELGEGVAPTADHVPSPLATEGFDSFRFIRSDLLSNAGLFDPISGSWHGSLMELPPSLHSAPPFSGRFQV